MATASSSISPPKLSDAGATETLRRDRVLSSKLYFDVRRSKDYEAKRYINQKNGTKTKEYLEQLDKAFEVARKSFDPELVIYNVGTDILDGDPLGRLKVSPDEAAIKDFRFAREYLPLIMMTSGAYMRSSA